VVTFPADLAQFWGCRVKHPPWPHHQLWHGRPPVPCTGSHTRWRDAIRNWLPIQINCIYWAPSLPR